MFGARYFGNRYFGPHYFGNGSDNPAIFVAPEAHQTLIVKPRLRTLRVSKLRKSVRVN